LTKFLLRQCSTLLGGFYQVEYFQHYGGRLDLLILQPLAKLVNILSLDAPHGDHLMILDDSLETSLDALTSHVAHHLGDLACGLEELAL
jgi:hypothetical protein